MEWETTTTNTWNDGQLKTHPRFEAHYFFFPFNYARVFGPPTTACFLSFFLP
jgi:hypothetical protein